MPRSPASETSRSNPSIVPRSGCTAQKSVTSYPQSALGETVTGLSHTPSTPSQVEVVQVLDDAPDVPVAVTVGVGEGPGVDLVEDAALPPRPCPGGGACLRPRRRFAHPGGSFCHCCLTIQQTPWGMPFLGISHAVVGGELLWSVTTRYWVGPANLSGP